MLNYQNSSSSPFLQCANIILDSILNKLCAESIFQINVFFQIIVHNLIIFHTTFIQSYYLYKTFGMLLIVSNALLSLTAIIESSLHTKWNVKLICFFFFHHHWFRSESEFSFILINEKETTSPKVTTFYDCLSILLFWKIREFQGRKGNSFFRGGIHN